MATGGTIFQYKNTRKVTSQESSQDKTPESQIEDTVINNWKRSLQDVTPRK